MSSDDFYQRCLVKLNQLKAQPTLYTPNLVWLRSMAFSFSCRDPDPIKMIDSLIPRIIPLAVAERLRN